MTTVSYPLRIPEEIFVLSRLRAQEEHLDQATTLRQFLHTGAEEYIVHLVAEGRISIGKAAEILNRTVYDLQRIAQKHGVRLGAAPEQARKSRETAKRIF